MDKRKPPSSRTVIARGGLLRTRRTQQGWSREQLAEKAEVSVGTVAKAENEQGVSPNKLAQIAEAVGEDYDDIVASDHPSLPSRKMRFTIEFDDGFDPPPWVIKLLAMISSQFPPPPPPDIERGSVLLTLRLHPDDVNRACVAFYEGRLASIGVSAITVPPRPPQPLLQTFVRIQAPKALLALDILIVSIEVGSYQIAELGVFLRQERYRLVVPFNRARFARKYEAEAAAISDVIAAWPRLPLGSDMDTELEYFRSRLAEAVAENALNAHRDGGPVNT